MPDSNATGRPPPWLLGLDLDGVAGLYREGEGAAARRRLATLWRGWGLPKDGPRLTRPVSQCCTESQFHEPAYARWCEALREAPRTHRKQWEFCYILQVLETACLLDAGRKGLGFGVGAEPLTAIFAGRGVTVTATDLSLESAQAAGWVDTQQHARRLDDLNNRGICPPEVFAERVRFETVDMNAVPDHLAGYDFTWSACAFEHLGSIEHGIAFVLRSLETLAPGGIAVHTTEFNVLDGPTTHDNDGTVLFRRRDLERLIETARRRGYRCRVDWRLGEGELDRHIDVAPYSVDRHLKLALAGYVTTSFGLVFEKPGRRI
jgi:hypothetical protein